MCSSEDKSTYPLFGDAGTCTAVEFDPEAFPMTFAMHTDGSGAEAIIVPSGGFRNRESPESFEMVDYGEGIVRNSLQVSMEGMSVFTFGISKAPKVVNELLGVIGENSNDIDYFTFHE